jgi:hypothetical protein
MKAKYLIQISTGNPNLGATGWFTVSGAMTRAAADSLLQDFIAAQSATDERALRVISYDNFTKEHRAANHAAMRAAHIGVDYAVPGAERSVKTPGF